MIIFFKIVKKLNSVINSNFSLKPWLVTVTMVLNFKIVVINYNFNFVYMVKRY